MWVNEKIIPFRRSGKWISGAILQRNENGEKRIKIFKGVIKDSGSVEVNWKGKKYKVSLIQRYNIPSRRYWEELSKIVEHLLKEVDGNEEKQEVENEEYVSLDQFMG